MGIHRYFFICIFIVAAVATEDLRALTQGKVLIFTILMGHSSITAVTLEFVLAY